MFTLSLNNLAKTQGIRGDLIIPSATTAGDLFGFSVSIDGEYAIIGAPQNYPYSLHGNGAAYIFKYEDSKWVEKAKLTVSNSDSTYGFGYKVEISGEYVIIGAEGIKDGYVWTSSLIFHRTGEKWFEQFRLNDGDSWDINGDYAVIGSTSEEGTSGAVYVFKRNGESWVQDARLTSSNPVWLGWFGTSVAIDGSYLIVGESQTSGKGAAYIFKRDSSTWFEEARITPRGAQYYDHFGSQVDLSGVHAIIGASNSKLSYIYQRNDIGWTEIMRINGYGDIVAIDGDYVLIGGELENSAYVFKRVGDKWPENARLLTRPLTSRWLSDESFLSISGNYCIIGAPWDNEDYSGAGVAYIFDLTVPFVQNPIDDQFFARDFATDTIANLKNVFSDLQSERLTYSFISDNGITLKIDNDNLIINSELGWEGVCRVVVKATDELSSSVNDTFIVAVNEFPYLSLSLDPESYFTNYLNIVIDGFNIKNEDFSILINDTEIYLYRTGDSKWHGDYRMSSAGVFTLTINYKDVLLARHFSIGSVQKSGGIGVSYDQKFTISFPPNSVESDLYFPIIDSSINKDIEEGSYRVGIINLELTQPATIKYVSNDENLAIYYRSDDEWIELPTKYENGYLTTKTVQLGDFKLDSAVLSEVKSQLLGQYPNPFNSQTNFNFIVGAKNHYQRVQLKIYNIVGQLINTVIDEELPAGNYSKVWTGLDRNGKVVASGVYLYSLQIGAETFARKIALVR